MLPNETTFLKKKHSVKWGVKERTKWTTYKGGRYKIYLIIQVT